MAHLSTASDYTCTYADLLSLMEELGFDGLWGFAWQQIEVDNITDRGCPWGLYYMSPDDRLKPAAGRGIIALPWLIHDLLKTWYSKNGTIYSNDPNDVARAGICSWDDIAYWKGFADNYIRNAHTASSYMLWEDTLARTPNPDYAWNSGVGPWPRTFFYYDRDAQMIFADGKVQPDCIRNYHRRWDNSDYYAEPYVPILRLVRDTRFHWSREIVISVTSAHAMPYGMVLWGDYSLYKIGECPNLVEGKIIPHELLFVRYDLEEGENVFTIKLQGK